MSGAPVTLPACPVCGGAGGAPFLEAGPLPALCNAMFPTADLAKDAPVGRIELCICSTCGMIWNRCYDPSLVAYSARYENSLHFSGAFGRYAAALADRLVERWVEPGRPVLEIGPGSGDFLAMLVERGVGAAVGFDPSYDPARAGTPLPEGAMIRSEPYPIDRPVDASLVVCRHVLEHLDDPASLVAGVGRSLSRGAFYAEVPDATFMLDEAAIGDVIFEHCGYFAAPSLTRMFTDAGFAVADLGRSFGEQYLWIEAVRGLAGRPASVAPNAGPTVETLVARAAAFARRYAERAAAWEALAASSGGPVAVWGAGSKGVTFCALVPDAVGGVIDVNPRKHGWYTPVTGHRIDPPTTLPALDPAVVVVMNPVYRDEIAADVAALGLRCPVVVA